MEVAGRQGGSLGCGPPRYFACNVKNPPQDLNSTTNRYGHVCREFDWGKGESKMKCNKCKGAMGLPATGHCKNCGAGIGRRSDSLCSTCSKNLNQCETCRKPLTDDDKDPFAS